MPSDFGSGVGANFLNQALNTFWSIPQGFLGNWISNLGYSDRMQTNYDYAQKMVDYQNRYNEPKNVMARLAAAGLNPNLIYGQGAGQMASASGSVASSGVTSPQYSTADVAASALNLAQMKQADAAKNDMDASARLKNAEASLKEMEIGYKPLLMQYAVEQAEKNLQKTAEEINLTKQDVQYRVAQQGLAEAETAFKNSEISLQQYRKQQIIAQTALFVSEKRLKEAQTDFVRSQDYQLNVQTQVDVLELKYKQMFYGDDGRMKELSEAEYNRLHNQFLHDAQTAAALLGIEGSKAAQWSNWIASLLGRILGGAGVALGGAGSIVKAFK